MLYFKKNQSNNIVVTWTDRATSDVAPYYILVLTHIATNFEYTIPLLKAANLSEYLERYDKFAILNEFTKEGQYKYVAYESNTSAITGVIGVVETGLAQVEVSQEAYATNAGVTTYVEYGEAGTPSNPAPAPIITPLEGIYAGFVLVTLTGDGSIYYTLDGSVPTAQNGTAYSEPFFVTATALVRARQYMDGATPGLIADSYYTIIPLAVSTDPEAGQYLASVEVALVANSEDAEVRFTLDGSTPTSGSTLYVAPIDVEVNTTIKAISIDPPAANSAVFEFDFDIQALTPTVAPASGTFINEQAVVFTNPNPLGQVWASLNGGAFEVVTSETFTEITSYVAEVRADEYVTSEQVSGVVNIQCAAATFEPAAGTYEEPFELTINTTTSGSTIYYTLDGSTPTTDSLVYDPLDKPTISETSTPKALVVKAGLVDSEVSEVQYIIPVIAYLAANTLRAYLSIDRGDTWDELQPYGNVDKIYRLAQARKNGNPIVLGSSVDAIRVTYDGGLNWVTPTMPNDNVISNIRNPIFIDGQLAVFVATHTNTGQNNVFISDDNLASFQSLVVNENTTGSSNFTSGARRGDVILITSAGVDSSAAFLSTNKGVTWQLINDGGRVRGSFPYISEDGQNIFFGARNQNDSPASFAVYVSFNQGVTGVFQTAPVLPVFGACSDNLQYMIIASVSSQPQRSVNTGDTWTALSGISGNVRDIKSSTTGQYWMIVTTQKAYLSTDFGATFTETQPVGNVNRDWQVGFIQ
jgi:hypothetical protein